LPGDKGAIASALITGKRDTISTPVNEAMYASGLAHVLSISGYHMAVVAGLMFFVFRALFALMPAFSSRHPIQEMGGARGAGRGGVLSPVVGCGGCDPALLHHDRHRPHRSDGRPPHAHLPHAHGRGVRRAAARTRSDRSPEFPNVVCGNAGARRRVPAGPAVDEQGWRY